MRAVSWMRAGCGRTILFAVLTIVLAGWLALSAPDLNGRLTAGSNPDAGMQTADPGFGSGGGGG